MLGSSSEENRVFVFPSFLWETSITKFMGGILGVSVQACKAYTHRIKGTGNLLAERTWGESRRGWRITEMVSEV